jgi:hypothetical protein
MISLMFKAILKTVVFLLVISTIYHLCPSLISADDDVAGSTTASVSVPPRASDLQLSTVLDSDSSTFAQGQEFGVQITYGSHLHFAASMTIVGQWTQGTIDGEVNPNVDILDYVPGTATLAYNDVTPVVDLVNRTITWTISSFPAQLYDQTLSFRLKTNSNYTASQKVAFTVKAYMTDSETTINAPDINRNYQFNPPGPTAAPTSAPTIAPTPTPQPFAIKTVNVQTVSDNNVTIYIATTQPSKSKIYYGTSASALSRSAADNSFGLTHWMTMSNLLPDTKYYFDVTADNASHNLVGSDIFVVKTAAKSETPTIALNTFAVTSANKLLVAPVNQVDETPTAQEQKTLVIPQSIIYDLRFSFKESKSLKSVKVVLRKKKQVLGAATSIFAKLFNFNNQNSVTEENSLGILPTAFADNVNIKEVGLTEIQPGVYYGRLISNLPTGEYELFAIASDYNGNITETKLSNVKIINRLTILSKETSEPIENARIYLSFYNSHSKRYEPLLPTLISITNPSYTDVQGESSLVLPQGKYRILASNLGYKDKTVDFTIGIGSHDGFPTVFLEKESFNLLSMAIYYGRSIRDVYIYYTLQYFTALSQSLRFFNLINAISLGLFVIVTLLSFRFRTHIPLRSIFAYFVYHLRKLGGKNLSELYLEGTVLDGTNKKPIGKAQIYLIESKSRQTVEKTTTNVNGHFFFSLNNQNRYEILAVKEGYEITPAVEAAKEINENKTIRIILRKSESQRGFLKTIATRLIEAPVGYLFEYLLVSSFLFEVTSIPYFGLGRTFPFILISGFNLCLWILHLKQKSQTQKVI